MTRLGYIYIKIHAFSVKGGDGLLVSIVCIGPKVGTLLYPPGIDRLFLLGGSWYCVTVAVLR